MSRRSPFSSLPFERWPDRDRYLFEAARRPGDILEPGGLASTWRPKTVIWATENYGYWLTWLDRRGELDQSEDPARRCTAERLSAYLNSLQEHLAPATVATRLRALKRTLAVMCPEADLQFLYGTVRRLDTTPSIDRRARLRLADELLDYGIAIMTGAESLEDTPKRCAQRYRNGLIIALLSYRPLRRRNLANLHLGVHLLRLNGGWRIRIAGEETKSHRPIDEPVPHELVPFMERYLSHFRDRLFPRSVLIPDDAGPLFISSRNGRAMSGHTINLTVGPLIAQRFGKPMNLHMFRQASPTMLAIKAPAHVRLGAVVNNHADYRTTERAYNLARAMDAAESHLDNLRALRRRFRR
jgi:integrase/recombinase XerD